MPDWITEIDDLIDTASLDILQPDIDKTLEFPGMYWVYVHEYNGQPIYVGITNERRPELRWRHGHGYDKCLFGDFIKATGWSRIKHYIVAFDLTRTEAEDLERKLIERLKTYWVEGGYNASEGSGTESVPVRQKKSQAHLGHILTATSKKKIATQLRLNNNRGKAVMNVASGIIYPSAAEAERQCGISRKTICRKAATGGKEWIYLDNNKNNNENEKEI